MRAYFKFFLSILSIFFTFPSFSAEKQQYITEDLHTYLRSGAGDQYRIIGAIKAGASVAVLEQKNKYSFVRDARQREGWVLTDDLSNHPSSKEENPQLKTKINDLTLKLNSLDETWNQRVSEIQRRSVQAEEQSNALLEENTQLKRELDMLRNKNRGLETMLDANKQAIAIQWFIYGGGVLGIGLLLGLILPRLFPTRRRRPSGWA